MAIQIKPETRQALQSGLVIPACPLALNARRQLDERRQRALLRYYIAAGAGGLAVGVHTTQFSIRNPKVGLFRPVLELAGEELGLAQTGSTATHYSVGTVGENVPPHPGPSAVELRSADFSPPPSGLAKTARSGLKSALQVPRNSLNSTAVHPGPLPHERENQPQFRGRPTTSGSTRPNEAAAFSDGKSDEANEPSASVIHAVYPGLRIGIAGICGRTRQALEEAALAVELGYHAGLLSLGALADATDDELLDHCRAVAEIIPVMGFYLQPAAGGRVLPYSFWRRFAEIESIVAVKIAPFNRYQTLDVIRAFAEAGRDDIALYTGNDDNIVMDLLTPWRFRAGGKMVESRIVGGLLGHWAVWTKKAVELHAECRRVALAGEPVPVELMRRAVEITDANAAFFDAANGYAGCLPGIHEVLRRQGLLEGLWCLDAKETLSPGQAEEIDRVCRAYPHLTDDEFVSAHRDEWLAG